ncbi:MAG: hypothetical protein J6P60_03450, partial [Lachnospiraceae bacterium]|nr:hypothetical protein [Lachnospiraceae bacterium]
LVVLPVTFFTGGGIYGGSPLWFLFCALYISMIVMGYVRYLYWGMEMVVAVVCYYTAYEYPDLVTQHTDLIAYQDAFASLVIVGVMVSLLVGFAVSI